MFRKLALAALLSTACGASAAEVVPSRDVIAVSGEGRAAGQPDVLVLDLGVSVLRPSTGKAVADAAALADKLVAALKAKGIAAKDLQTRSYDVYPEWDHTGPRPKIVGYRVTNTLAVKIREIAKAGEIIDAATAAGGNDAVVNGLRFELESDLELQKRARAEAWADARAKAEQLATLAGVALGRPLTIAETSGAVPPPMPMFRTAMAESSATPIEPGQVDVVVTIAVEFAIGP